MRGYPNAALGGDGIQWQARYLPVHKGTCTSVVRCLYGSPALLSTPKRQSDFPAKSRLNRESECMTDPTFTATTQMPSISAKKAAATVVTSATYLSVSRRQKHADVLEFLRTCFTRSHSKRARDVSWFHGTHRLGNRGGCRRSR